MITFKQHLALVKEELDPDLMGTLVTDCSDFFDAARPTDVLWRGTRANRSELDSKYKVDFFQMAKRKMVERNPVDTDVHIHKLMNDYFVNEFNIPFRDGMMASTSRSQAREYNNRAAPLVIIPVNGTSYCYGTNVGDAHQQMYVLGQKLGREEDADDDGREFVTEFFKKYKYKAGKNILKEILQKHNGEVMLYPSSGNELKFYAFSEKFYFNKVLPEVKHYI